MESDTPVAPELIARTIELTAEQDMFDEVRAKLIKASGLCLLKQGQPAQAVEQFKRAVELDERCGVGKAHRDHRARAPARTAAGRRTSAPRTGQHRVRHTTACSDAPPAQLTERNPRTWGRLGS